jgi:DNA repair exonuclease SbcCD nuclease subunit
MSKRIAIGDPHLSGFESDLLDKDNLPLRLGYIFKSLEYIISYGKKIGITSFDILGDLVNDKNLIYTLPQYLFKNFLIKHKDCNFTIISGNHDLSSTSTTKTSAISVFSEYSNVKCFERGCTILDGVAYIPYCDDMVNLIKTCTDAKILISHLGLNEGILSSGMSVISDVSIKDLYRFKLAVLGHYHSPQDFGNDLTKVWYAGSLINKDWGDKNQIKRFLIYDTETCEVESIPINCGIPQFIELTINDESEKVEILKRAEIAKNSGHNVRIRNKTSDVVKEEVSGGVLVIEQREVDITNRGITISMTKEEQLKKYLSIKEIPEIEYSDYLSLVTKYDLLHKDE